MNAEITGDSHNFYSCCNYISCSAFNQNETEVDSLSLKMFIGMRAMYRILKRLGEAII
jgi:hypothetical protein